MQKVINYSRVLMVLLLFVLVSSATMVRAQDTVSEMEAVEVRAQSIEGQVSAELAQYGNAVDIITSEEIERGGYQDVGQILKGEVPGLYVGESWIGSSEVFSLQGSGSGDVLVLIDGVRVNNRLLGGGASMETINPYLIERIEVLKGGQGLFYGTDSIRGAINIILEKPDPDNGGTLGVGGGSFRRQEVFGDASSSAGEEGQHNYMVFGSHLTSDEFQPHPDEDYDTPVTETVGKPSRKPTRQNLGFKYHYNIDAGESLKFFTTYNQGDLPHSSIDRSIDVGNDHREIISTLKYDKRISDEFAYFIKAYYHDWHTEFTDLEANDTGNIKDEYDHYQNPWYYDDYGLNAMAKYRPRGWGEWVGGLDYQRYSGRDFVIGMDESTENVWAPFLQWRPELLLFPNTNLAIGGRYNLPSGEGNKGIWNVSLKHFFSSNLYLRGTTGTAFRLPTAVQLMEDSDDQVGNPDLEPEESFGGDVGFGGNFRLGNQPVTWDMGYFYTEVGNRIVDHERSGRRDTYRNIDDLTLVDGYEAKLLFRPFQSIQGQFSYTVTDAHEEESDEQISGRPESLARGKIRWSSADNRWGIDFISQYVGNLYERSTLEGTEETINYGEYFLLDLGAQYHRGPDQNETISLRVDNLLDEEYSTSISTGNFVGGSEDDHFIRWRGTPRSLQLRYTRSF